MRISELARATAVPLSAVKYYQREGLLPEGQRTAPNQGVYGDEHVQRIRLIRALLGIGGLSIATTKAVITALDSDGVPLAETFSIAQKAVSASPRDEAAPSDASRDRILRAAHAQGWHLTDDNPGIDMAARALDGLLAIDFVAPDAYLDAYATSAASAAGADLRALTTVTDPDGITELMVVGTILGDPLFAGLRRLAQEDATHHLFPVPPNPHESDPS